MAHIYIHKHGYNELYHAEVPDKTSKVQFARHNGFNILTCDMFITDKPIKIKEIKEPNIPNNE